MRCIALDRLGGPEALALGELPRPEPAGDDVLVRVIAAGVGPWDVKACEGLFGELPLPYVPGFEAAGVVEAMGAAVSSFRAGDHVYTYRHPGGSYAEYLATPAPSTALMPASTSFEEAAAVPVAALAAHEGLVDHLGVRSGETVLITGAAGGVGSFAVQIAAALGAEVIGTASPRNHPFLRELGASQTVDYADGDWVAAVRKQHPDGVDAALECVGGDTLPRAIDAVRDSGRVINLVPTESVPHAPRGISVRFFSTAADGMRLATLSKMIDKGQIRVHIEDVLPLERARKAHERVLAGHTRGKIVLSVAPQNAG